MSKIDQMFSLMNEYGFKVRWYVENGELCGYEIEGWTSHFDLNIPIFIDMRGKEITAENIWFQLNEYVEDLDCELETVKVWQDGGGYTLRELLDDFENFEGRLIDMSHDIRDSLGLDS